MEEKMVKVNRMVLGPVETNCFYAYVEGSKEALVFDPGDQGERVYERLKGERLIVKGILLTHGHFDHISGVEKLRTLSGAKVYASREEKEICERPELNCSSQMGRPVNIQVDFLLKDEEILEIGGMKIKTLYTPGHTKGGVCYYIEEEGILISGDTLFQDSVGRTDLPTGSMGTLVRSIKERIFVLPDNVRIYPGHGDVTTVAHEKAYNPFV